MDGNVSFISEIVEKGNLSNGYFYERNGITRLGIKVFFFKVRFSISPKIHKNEKYIRSNEKRCHFDSQI